MMRYATASLVLAASLLLTGLTGCSKKEVPTPTPPALAPQTSFHTLDGRATPGTGYAFEQQAFDVNGKLTVGIVLVLSSFPGGTNASQEDLNVYFYQPAGTTTYQLAKMVREVYRTTQYTTYTGSLQGTLTKTAQGNYTGTFAGTAPATTAQAASTITDGQFVEIKI